MHDIILLDRLVNQNQSLIHNKYSGCCKMKCQKYICAHWQFVRQVSKRFHHVECCFHILFALYQNQATTAGNHFIANTQLIHMQRIREI